MAQKKDRSRNGTNLNLTCGMEGKFGRTADEHSLTGLGTIPSTKVSDMHTLVNNCFIQLRSSFYSAN